MACTDKKRLHLAVAFGVYWLLMVVILFWVTPFDGFRSVSNQNADVILREFSNFVPFKTIVEYIASLFDQSVGIGTVIGMTVGNVVLAIPLGMMLPALFQRMRWVSATVITAVSVTFVLEFFQLILKLGSFDIDCMILRGVGAAIGFFIWKRAAAVRAKKNEQ